jgi:hypothetical protein
LQAVAMTIAVARGMDTRRRETSRAVEDFGITLTGYRIASTVSIVTLVS